MPIIFPVISVHAMPLKPFNPIFRVCWCKVVFVWHCFDMVLVLFLFLFLFLFAIFSTKEKKKIKVQEFKSLRVRVKEKLCEHRFEHSNNTRSLSLTDSFTHSFTDSLTHSLTRFVRKFVSLRVCCRFVWGVVGRERWTSGRVGIQASLRIYAYTHLRICICSCTVHTRGEQCCYLKLSWITSCWSLRSVFFYETLFEKRSHWVSFVYFLLCEVWTFEKTTV